MTRSIEDLATAVSKLIDYNQELGQKVIALTSLSAILVREICLLAPDAGEHLGQLEAQIGGIGEAISRKVGEVDGAPVSSIAITSTLEQALYLARNLLESSTKRH